MPQKHFYLENAVYFLTANTAGRKPFFKCEILAELFIEELKICRDIKKFKLLAFCVNYDHFHILIQPSKTANVSEIMRSLKTNFSRNANRVLVEKFETQQRPWHRQGFLPQKTNPQLGSEDPSAEGISKCALCPRSSDRGYERFVDSHDQCTLERGSADPRFDELDEKVRVWHQLFHQKFSNYSGPKFSWQKGFYDQICKNETDLQNKFHYCENNYLKHDLPENWKFTSLCFPQIIDKI